MSNLNEFEILNLLLDFEKYHSDFQIENFIINSQGNDWFRYKQCLREIKSRYENLISKKEDLELLNLKKNRRSFFLKLTSSGRKCLDILKNRERRRKQTLIEDIAETERELKKFMELAEILKKEIGGITNEKRRELEKQAWREKARKMAAIDLFIAGGLSRQTIEFILNLPINDQRNIFESLDGINKNKVLEILSYPRNLILKSHV